MLPSSTVVFVPACTAAGAKTDHWQCRCRIRHKTPTTGSTLRRHTCAHAHFSCTIRGKSNTWRRADCCSDLFLFLFLFAALRRVRSHASHGGSTPSPNRVHHTSTMAHERTSATVALDHATMSGVAATDSFPELPIGNQGTPSKNAKALIGCPFRPERRQGRFCLHHGELMQARASSKISGCCVVHRLPCVLSPRCPVVADVSSRDVARIAS